MERTIDDRLITPSTSPTLRTQALGIVQNFLADGALSDLTKAVDVLGEAHLVDAVASAMEEEVDMEVRAHVSSPVL